MVSPACDLLRSRTKRVMFLCGTLEELQPSKWSYKSSPARTTIAILPDGSRKTIEWDLAHVMTLSWDDVRRSLEPDGNLKVIGRVRDIYALEIQRNLLEGLGRIGRPAELPAPFPIDVSFFYVDQQREAHKFMDMEGGTAACYVGRDKDAQPVHRLVLTEQTCDQMQRELNGLEDSSVHRAHLPSLTAVKKDRSFFAQFERGEIEMSTKCGKKYIQCTDGKVGATIVRGGSMREGTAITADFKKAVLIVNVTDAPAGSTDCAGQKASSGAD